MHHWLLKTEPDAYSWSDLVSDGRAVWDGVANPTALRNIRAMRKGDRVLIYHTGDERAAVGIAQVTSDPYADPKANDPKLTVVDIRPVGPLKSPVTLADIKSDPAFAGWDLLRIGRLSVVAVPPAMWKHLEQLAKRPPAQKTGASGRQHDADKRAARRR
jgi:predicted RNA-binding protein with PUA-like domain